MGNFRVKWTKNGYRIETSPDETQERDETKREIKYILGLAGVIILLVVCCVVTFFVLGVSL